MSARSIRFWRRLVQTGVALAFIAIPILNRMEVHVLAGNFLSFNLAGIPLADPLATLQAAAGVLSGTAAMLVGAGISLALACLLGPVFCAWICPFGLLSELCHREKTADTKHSPSARAASFAGKGLLTAAGLLAVLLFVPTPLLNQLSMPGWYSRAMQHAILYKDALWGAVVIIPVVLLAERLSGKRFWCRYVCPQSVLISLAGLVLPGRFKVCFTSRSCTCPASARPCINACSLGLNPRRTGKAQYLLCTNCGDCVDACRKKGRALTFGFGKRCEPEAIDKARV